MALRAGAYAVCEWHGVIRDDGWPWYSCLHRHGSQKEAAACARDAAPALRARDHQDPEAPLPDGWRVHPHKKVAS